MKSNEQLGSFYAILSGFLYGFIGYFGLSAMNGSLVASTMLFWRFLISSIIIALILLPRIKTVNDSLKAMSKAFVTGMDMGGASVQIVFPIQKSETPNNKSQVELDLYGKHIYLYVQSFLGLGQTEVAHQYLNSASCFANNYPLPDGDYGQGNAFACKSEIASLMNEVHKVNQNIQPLLAANPVDSWYSIGGIANMADSSLFNFANNQLTSQNLLQQADKQICNQQWDNLDVQYPNDDYVYQYCLFSAYYYALMVDGYGLYPEQTINYIPPSQNLDWTLGVVLYH